MKLFHKPVKFISAICPECKGHLELDTNLKTAFCQYCGAQCIIENAPKKNKPQGKLETVLAYIERQKALKRQDKQEEQRRLDEEERQQKEHLKKFWWVYIISGFAFFGFILLLLVFSKQGII